jgi:hypothetical protein
LVDGTLGEVLAAGGAFAAGAGAAGLLLLQAGHTKSRKLQLK